MIYRWALSAVAGLLLLSGRAEAACPSPTADQTVKLPGRPFAAEPSLDNCHLYVSLDRNGKGAVTVLDNDGGTFRIARTANIAPRPARGLALSHSGALLAVAAEGSVVLLDAAKLGTPDAAATVATLPTANHGAIYTLFAKDDALLFVSEERNGSIAVVNVAVLQGSGERDVIGRIPVGQAPVGLALSADSAHLYSTSEIVGASEECRPEQEKGRRHAKAHCSRSTSSRPPPIRATPCRASSRQAATRSASSSPSTATACG